MIWALNDKSGIPAKQFADADPSPSVDWLDVLSERLLGYRDPNGFGAFPDNFEGEDVNFRIFPKPGPHSVTPLMAVVRHRDSDFLPLDYVMKQLSRWLVRHLDKPKMLLWVIKHGAVLHPILHREIEQKLKELEISVPMRKLWRLILSKQVKSNSQSGTLYNWKGSIKKYEESPLLLMELKETLRPHIELSEPIHWSLSGEQSSNSVDIKVSDLVRAEIRLNSSDARPIIQQLNQMKEWQGILVKFVFSATELLKCAMDLMFEVELASLFEDYSYIDQPSIDEHEQNNDNSDWTVLVELCRDSWIAAADTEPEMAKMVLNYWWNVPYQFFVDLFFRGRKESGFNRLRKSIGLAFS